MSKLHIQAGVTLGFKNLVGMLRDDSRMEFHADGSMFFGIKMFVSKYGLNTNYKNQNKFFEKITEISLAAQSKTRLTLISGRKAQVTFGPDKKVIGIFKAKEVYPETGFIFASANPIAAEVAGIAVLTYLCNQIPFYDKMFHKIALKFNGKAQELGKQSVWENPCIKRALEIGIGKRDFEAEFEGMEEGMREILAHLIRK